MTSQFFGLMRLAWKQCEYDMVKLTGLYIGGWIFALAVMAFTILNLAFNFNQTITTKVYPDLVGTQIGAVLMSLTFGVTNALYTLAFLFIIVALFEYAYAFLRVAYEYDECSWEMVKFPEYCKQRIIEFLKWLDALGASGRMTRKGKRARELEELRKEISELKVSGMLDKIDAENIKIE